MCVVHTQKISHISRGGNILKRNRINLKSVRLAVAALATSMILGAAAPTTVQAVNVTRNSTNVQVSSDSIANFLNYIAHNHITTSNGSLPLRHIAEHFGARVTWDASTSTANIIFHGDTLIQALSEHLDVLGVFAAVNFIGDEDSPVVLIPSTYLIVPLTFDASSMTLTMGSATGVRIPARIVDDRIVIPVRAWGDQVSADQIPNILTSGLLSALSNSISNAAANFEVDITVSDFDLIISIER